METTKAEINAAMKVVAAIGLAIYEAKEIPSGHLYATVMGTVTLDQYEKIIGMLKDQKLVAETPAHLLRWVGPALDTVA